jgi:pimeloyl-ACP methyl ester carboxylesterase
MAKINLSLAIGFLGLLILTGDAYAGQYVRVSPDLELFYEEAGTGTPIIFIPGWIGTTEFFKAQIAHFSENYRAIVYDPRSQGRSSKTLDNNNYGQHGRDLRGFIDALMLEEVVLVGHSLGCADAYSYFRAYGTENIRAFVCIDQPPKQVAEQEGDWGSIVAPADFKAVTDGLNYDRLNFTREFIPTMFVRPMAQGKIDEMADEMMKTPTHAAITLSFDGNLADYSPEARMIDGQIAVLNVLADQEGHTEVARDWLARNAPHSAIVAFGYHSMFSEFPERFNTVVEDFLGSVK